MYKFNIFNNAHLVILGLNTISYRYRVRAMQCLKRKRLYEQQIEQLENFHLRIHGQVIILEGAKATTETLDALRTGASAMKAVQKATNIDDVDKTMDEIKSRRSHGEHETDTGSLGYLMVLQQPISMRMSWKQSWKYWKVLNWGNSFSILQQQHAFKCAPAGNPLCRCPISRRPRKTNPRHCRPKWHFEHILSYLSPYKLIKRVASAASGVDAAMQSVD